MMYITCKWSRTLPCGKTTPRIIYRKGSSSVAKTSVMYCCLVIIPYPKLACSESEITTRRAKHVVGSPWRCTAQPSKVTFAIVTGNTELPIVVHEIEPRFIRKDEVFPIQHPSAVFLGTGVLNVDGLQSKAVVAMDCELWALSVAIGGEPWQQTSANVLPSSTSSFILLTWDLPLAAWSIFFGCTPSWETENSLSVGCLQNVLICCKLE